MNGRWTTKPPTEPGWYWQRFMPRDPSLAGDPEIVSLERTRAGKLEEWLNGLDYGRPVEEREYIEWWSMPIEEPPSRRRRNDEDVYR